MRRAIQAVFCAAALVFAAAGCSQGGKSGAAAGIPIPQSAKRLSADTVEIPFPPYRYTFSGGTERWIPGRAGSKGNLVFDVLWNDRPAARFTLGTAGAGTYPIRGRIELGGTLYSGVSITLNADADTGTIRFQKAAGAAPEANSR